MLTQSLLRVTRPSTTTLTSSLSRLSLSLCSTSYSRPISSTIYRTKPTIRSPWSNRTQPQTSAMLVQIRGMKTRSSVKRLCDGCKPVRRKGRVFVICSKNPKHKQRQGK